MIVVDELECAVPYFSDKDAVIFDLDDTLYSEKEYVRSGFSAVAAAFPEFPTMKEQLFSAFLARQPAIDVVFERLGIAERAEEALAVYRHHEPRLSLYPGVAAMLARLSSEKKIGIITDGRPAGQRAKLRALNLLSVPFIITDELGGVEFRKPCPRAFSLMLDRLQVSADRALYIGDNPKKDGIAPEGLGMSFILFHNRDGIYYR